MINYKPRYIKFKELIKTEDWVIKVYTISKEVDFDFESFYGEVEQQLPGWLASKNGFNSKHYHIGFLILHAASEGVFSIINWWLDGYMLNTCIFLSEHDDPSSIKKISGNGLGPCVWELEVINYERIAWTNHVLKKAPKSDFDIYLNNTFNATL